MQIRENLLNLTSKRGRSRFSHMMMPHSGNVNAKENIGAYIETMLEAFSSLIVRFTILSNL